MEMVWLRVLELKVGRKSPVIVVPFIEASTKTTVKNIHLPKNTGETSKKSKKKKKRSVNRKAALVDHSPTSGDPANQGKGDNALPLGGALNGDPNIANHRDVIDPQNSKGGYQLKNLPRTFYGEGEEGTTSDSQ